MVLIVDRNVRQKGKKKIQERSFLALRAIDQRKDVLLNASSAPGAPFLSGCICNASYNTTRDIRVSELLATFSKKEQIQVIETFYDLPYD